jgi:hypothetical protein
MDLLCTFSWLWSCISLHGSVVYWVSDHALFLFRAWVCLPQGWSIYNWCLIVGTPWIIDLLDPSLCCLMFLTIIVMCFDHQFLFWPHSLGRICYNLIFHPRDTWRTHWWHCAKKKSYVLDFTHFLERSHSHFLTYHNQLLDAQLSRDQSLVALLTTCHHPCSLLELMRYKEIKVSWVVSLMIWT